MVEVMEEFQVWLGSKLLSLESDDSVITDYINGILTGDESQSEKEEALEGILCGIMESGIEDFCHEIFTKWNQCVSRTAENGENGATPKVDLEDQLSKIMEQQNLSATVTEKPKVSSADKKLKEAILQQYAEVSDHEEDEEGGGGEDQLEGGKNTNRDEVTREEQERRERMKAEAAAKREKDKLDREKQKQQQAERKDKEKKRTAKTEKRR